MLSLSARLKVGFIAACTLFSNTIEHSHITTTTNLHNKTMPDSHSSVLDKTACAFNASHWTFHFESTAKINNCPMSLGVINR